MNKEHVDNEIERLQLNKATEENIPFAWEGASPSYPVDSVGKNVQYYIQSSENRQKKYGTLDKFSSFFNKPLSVLQKYAEINDTIGSVSDYVSSYIPTSEKSKFINDLKTRYNKAKRPFQSFTHNLEKNFKKSSWVSKYKSYNLKELKKLPLFDKAKYSITQKVPKVLRSLRQGANSLPGKIGKVLKLSNRIAPGLNILGGTAEIALASPEERKKTTYKVIGRLAGDYLGKFVGGGAGLFFGGPPGALIGGAAGSMVLSNVGESIGEKAYNFFHKSEQKIEIKTLEISPLYSNQYVSNPINPDNRETLDSLTFREDNQGENSQTETIEKETVNTFREDEFAQAFIKQLIPRIQNTCIA